MKKRWWIIIGLALLLAATCIVAAMHLQNQENIQGVQILWEGQKLSVSLEALDQGEFSGELIDGKGDKSFHKYTGILLRDLLESKGIDLEKVTGVTVTSADNFTATFTAEEVLQADKIYVAVTADGKQIHGIDPGTEGVQVIVFGDENSRRCVRFAQKITVE